MHAVCVSLLQAQVEAVGLPLWTVSIPNLCSNQQYEMVMGTAIQRALAAGVSVMAFGDLFLEDVRRYRESQLAGTGLAPLFPIWGLSTRRLAREMISAGLRARLTCVDPKQIHTSFVGREFDDALLADLPATADPCGERGEFHTFAYAGPMFHHPVPIQTGEIVTRDGFVFADLR
jgi:diphthamide synthase (EF-2-diphthine--ammonia ligase)